MICAKWYNTGFPEDITGSDDARFFLSGPGGSIGERIPDPEIDEQTMEMSVVGADSSKVKGMGRLMVAQCLRSVDTLNATHGNNYTRIIATLGRKNGMFNTRFANILHSFGFIPVKVYNAGGQRWRCGGDVLAAMVLTRQQGEASFITPERLSSNVHFYDSNGSKTWSEAGITVDDFGLDTPRARPNPTPLPPLEWSSEDLGLEEASPH